VEADATATSQTVVVIVLSRVATAILGFLPIVGVAFFVLGPVWLLSLPFVAIIGFVFAVPVW
jgi:hypothetical protein